MQTGPKPILIRPNRESLVPLLSAHERGHGDKRRCALPGVLVKGLYALPELLDRRVAFDEAAELLACVHVHDLKPLTGDHLHGGFNTCGLEFLCRRVNVVRPNAEVVDAEAVILVHVRLVRNNFDELDLNVFDVAQCAAAAHARVLATIR